MAALVVTGVLGFYWAGKNGQFKNLDEGAKVIFDEDEPIGKPTDMVFPVKKKNEESENAEAADAADQPENPKDS